MIDHFAPDTFFQKDLENPVLSESKRKQAFSFISFFCSVSFCRAIFHSLLKMELWMFYDQSNISNSMNLSFRNKVWVLKNSITVIFTTAMFTIAKRKQKCKEKVWILIKRKLDKISYSHTIKYCTHV